MDFGLLGTLANRRRRKESPHSKNSFCGQGQAAAKVERWRGWVTGSLAWGEGLALGADTHRCAAQRDRGLGENQTFPLTSVFFGLGLPRTNRRGWRYLIWGVQAGGNLPLNHPPFQGPRAESRGYVSSPSPPSLSIVPPPPTPAPKQVCALSAGGHTAALHRVGLRMSLQAGAPGR